MNSLSESFVALQESTGLSFILLSILTSLALIVIISTFVTAISDMMSLIPKLRKDKWKLAVVSISIVFCVMFVSYSYNYIFKPAPVIGLHNNDIKVQNTLYFEWEFDRGEADEEDVQYVVDIYNKTTNERKTTQPIIHNNYSTDEIGELEIQVIALLGGKAYSKSNIIKIKHYKTTLDKIFQTREMVVGVYNDPSEGAFSYQDSEGNNKGFDVDLITMIATNLFTSELNGKNQVNLIKDRKDNDINIIFKYHEWGDLMRAVGSGNIDLAIASITIRKDREKEYDIVFSKPYIETTIAAIGTSDSISKFEKKQYDELKYGMISKTTSYIFYTEVLMNRFNLSEINRQAFVHNKPLFAALGNADVDIVFYDYIRTQREIEKHPDWKRVAINPVKFNIDPERYGIVINKNDISLKNRIDEILSIKEAEIQSLKNKYKLN